jgi:hypothetical protein
MRVKSGFNKLSPFVTPGLVLALAGCADMPSGAMSSEEVALVSGVYEMIVTPTGGDHSACNDIRGMAEAKIHDRAVVTLLFSPLEFAINKNGSVSGWGVESMSGWAGTTRLTGKQVASGYSGEYVSSKWSVNCLGTWSLMKRGG